MMTRQEKNVFDLLVKGYSSREIAKELFISFHTVETHRKNLRTKFGVHSTTEMVAKVYETAVIQ
jgi:DNA-binding CsgD family transcriptional regulator